MGKYFLSLLCFIKAAKIRMHHLDFHNYSSNCVCVCACGWVYGCVCMRVYVYMRAVHT